MSERWRLVLATLLLAAVVHLGVVLAVPYVVMGRILDVAIAEAGGVNQAVAAPIQDAGERTVIRPSPDILYTACAYDVSRQPLRVTAPLPDSYASLALFAGNTNVTYVVNDREVGDEIDITLVAPGAEATAPEGATVIETATDRGLVLIRFLIEDESRLAELDAVRREATCEPQGRPEP